MKKIYTNLFLLPSLLVLFSDSVKAQSSCPPGPPPVATSLNIGGVCVVFADHLWPNATAVLFDINLVVIGSATTDEAGLVSIVYSCSGAPYFVTTCATSGCCNVLVPPQAFLPIKLTEFNAKLNANNSVLLSWTSVAELSSYKYIIQRSIDGKNFTDVSEVAASGNSNKPIKYTFTENNFNGGVSYFRLKQVDLDGRYEFSKVLYVNNKKALTLVTAIAPNPFTTDFQLIGISSSEINYKNIRVFNAYGQSVQYNISGANAIALNPASPKGIYLLKIKNQTFKLFKN